MRAPNPEIRAVTRNGELGEILPDWRGLDYLDDTMDVGSVQFDYPEKGGIRRFLIGERREYALLLDGKEVDNSRFLLDAHSGNRATDTPGYITWTGKTYIARCDEAIVGPINDEARLDVLTKEERQQFLQARDEWVKKQIKKIRKKHLLEPFNLHADDDDKDTRKADFLGGWEPVDRDAVLDEGAWDETGQAEFGEKLQEMNLTTVTWKDKIKPWYWRHRFEPSSDLQERLDTAPPPQPPSFKKVTPGAFVRALFDQAQSRGSLDGMRIDFSATRDSSGEPWKETLSRKPDVGSTLLEQLRWLAEAKKAEPRMRQRTLQLFNADFGRPDRASVLFAKGHNIVDGPQEGSSEELVTAVFASSDTGVHGWVYDQKLVDRFGVIEGVFEAQGVQTWRELRQQARQFLRDNGRRKEQNTFGVVIDRGTRPYKDFRAGSWVLVDTDGKPEPQRIRAITLSWDDNRVPSCGVTLNDRLYEADITNQRLLRAMSGKKFGQATMGRVNAFQASSTSDARPPSKPAAPTVSSRNGAVEVGYDWTDADGYQAIWDQDHAEVHMSAEEDYQPDDTTLVNRLYTAGSTVLSDLPYNEARYVRFVAVDKGGDRSEPSDIVPIVAAPVTGGDIGGDVTLPPQLIGSVPPENITAGRFQSDLSVAGALWVAEYASEDEGETQPSETSAITKITSDIGFQFLQPDWTADELTTIRVNDPDFEQTWTQTVLFPNTAFDENGERVAAVFRGRVEADTISVTRRLRIQGNASLGETSHITPEAALQLDNLVADPDVPPSVTFAPKMTNWPATASQYEEIGWGIDGNFVVQGRVFTNSFGNLNVLARYMDSSGNIDHTVELDLPFSNVAGFTAINNRTYVLVKFRSSDPWSIMQFGAAGGWQETEVVDGVVDGPWKAALGVSQSLDAVMLVYRDPSDTVKWIERDPANVNNPAPTGSGPFTTDVVTGKRMVGITRNSGHAVICADSEIHWVDDQGPGMGWASDPARHWWSNVGSLKGFGLLPGTTDDFAGSNQTGRLARYNTIRQTPIDLEAYWTRYDSVTDRETGASPPQPRSWPSRLYATITVGEGIAPGTDGILMYAFVPLGGEYVLLPKDPAALSVTIADFSGTVIGPPATSEFVTGDATNPGCIQSQSTIPGTTRPAVKICGDSYAELYGLRKPWLHTSRNVIRTLDAGVWTTMFWNNKIDGDEWGAIVDSGSGVITVSQDGVYTVSAKASANGLGSGTRLDSRLMKNGIEVASDGAQSASTTKVSTSIAGFPIRMLAGDTLRFDVRQNSGASQTTTPDAVANWIVVTRDHM